MAGLRTVGRQLADRLAARRAFPRPSAERLLHSVTDMLGVGLIRQTRAGAVAENAIMAAFARDCGGLAPFVATCRSDGDLTLVDAAGIPRRFEVRAAGEVEAGLILVKDVTEARRAEETVHGLALLPAQSPHPVLRVGADGVISHANPASRDLLADWRTAIGQRCRPPGG